MQSNSKPVKKINYRIINFILDVKIGTGGQCWPAGYALINHLRNQIKSTKTTKLFQPKHHLNILELGAGTGLVSICLTQLLKKYQVDECNFWITDLKYALDGIHENLQLNAINDECIHVDELQWYPKKELSIS